MEKFEYKGLWFFPQFPDHKVSGVLKFDPIDGATLETIGDSFMTEMMELYGKTLADNVEWRTLPSNLEIDIIWGFSEKGDAITLHKCREMGQVLARGYTGSVYSAVVVFVGCLFDNMSDLNFDMISIRYPHLEEWLGITGFSGQYSIARRGDDTFAEVKYNAPKRIEVELAGAKIVFDYNFYHNLWGPIPLKRVQLEQSAFIEITPTKAVNYWDYQSDIIYYLRNFFSLATGSAMLPIHMKGRNPGCEHETFQGEKLSLNDVFMHYVPNGARVNIVESNSVNFLFRYTDLESNFATYLGKWFSISEKLRPVHDLYFGLFYIPSMYIHLQFLTLAQCLETYHRRMYDGVYMNEKDYEAVQVELTDAIPEVVTSEHKRSLSDRIKYGNEYSLRTRLRIILRDVLSEYAELTTRIIHDRNTFIDKVVQKRNYLTHYPPDSDNQIDTNPSELYTLAQQLKLIMQLCFLKEMGIPFDIVKKVTAENHGFQRWA